MSLRVISGGLLREVEVSITPRCSLACRECGFFVPRQPAPAVGDPVDELAASLGHLARIGVRIGSLAVMGGEPTLDGGLLAQAVQRFRALEIAERLEVVTNGLTPRGLRPEALAVIDRVTISVYGYDEGLLERWRTWLQLAAPNVELVLRRADRGWDAWSERAPVSPDAAQALYESCWYRRHCVTVERGRLFACSRIPKLSRDAEGLVLDERTTLADVEGWLHRPAALPSCATCAPMMDLPPVPAGQQPDDRIPRLQAHAIRWLDEAIAKERTR